MASVTESRKTWTQCTYSTHIFLPLSYRTQHKPTLLQTSHPQQNPGRRHPRGASQLFSPPPPPPTTPTSTTTLRSPSIQSTVPADSCAIVHSPSFCTGTRPSGNQTLNRHPLPAPAPAVLEADDEFQVPVELSNSGTDEDDVSGPGAGGGSCPAKRRLMSCFAVSRSGHWSAGTSRRGRMRLPLWTMLMRRVIGVWGWGWGWVWWWGAVVVVVVVAAAVGGGGKNRE